MFIAILAAWICGCSGGASRRQPCFVTESDAELISIIRDAAIEEDFSLKDAIYQVRPDGDGWIVQVDRAPGYNGVGSPYVIIDATFFVKFNGDGEITEILDFMRKIKPRKQRSGSK
ncbi:MAG TPA: hypothetical protein VFC46_11960 [Humisphaera sp.]|nr:hypothetical protein [Humisphaera sp.]